MTPNSGRESVAYCKNFDVESSHTNTRGPDIMKNKKTITFEQIKEQISPPILTILDEMVVSYIAQRKGITLERARAAIDENAEVRASYQRKMTRAALALVVTAGFQMGKSQHKPTAPKPSKKPLPDVSAMLSCIMGKPQQPGTGAA